MSQFVTVGSTNTIKENEVKITIEEGDITIKISRVGEPFKLKGCLKVLEVSNIIDKPHKGNVIFKNGGKGSEFIFDKDTNIFFYNIGANAALSLKSFDILITGTKNPNFQNSDKIKVEIPLEDGSTETIEFNVVSTENPMVNTFTADNHIVQQGRQNLTLTYEIKGEAEKVTLFENAKELAVYTNIQKLSIPIKFEDNKLSGLYEYTLQATKGNQMISKSISVVYVQKSSIKSRLQPDNWKIINFCAAQNGDYFFALMSDTDGKRFQIGHTDQIDGKENWSTIHITDPEKMKLFVSSPMLHLQSENEKNDRKLGRLLFIGGSMIGNIPGAEVAGDQVAIIDLGSEGNNITLNPLPTSVFAHSCVLFPTATDPNTIWLLCGEDKYGAPSNKIWTSADCKTWTSSDGKTWTSADGKTWTSTDGKTCTEKTDKIRWAPRCMASVTVSWKYEGKQRKKDALWLAGGFENRAASGPPNADLWKYQDNIWAEIKVEDLGAKIKDSKALALPYGGVEETGHTGLYLLGNNGSNKYFFGLKKDNKDNYLLAENSTKVDFNHFNQGSYITAFFRECLWVMGLYYKGSSGITCSDCYYRIPTIHEDTTNFYNN